MQMADFADLYYLGEIRHHKKACSPRMENCGFWFQRHPKQHFVFVIANVSDSPSVEIGLELQPHLTCLVEATECDTGNAALVSTTLLVLCYLAVD